MSVSTDHGRNKLRDTTEVRRQRRDEFAMAAFNLLLPVEIRANRIDGIEAGGLAVACYALADAMILQRARPETVFA